MPDTNPLDKQPVAAADKAKNVKDQEGVSPIVTNPDQPVFPRPVGVTSADLEAQGVLHGYAVDAEAEASADAEAKNADKDADEKKAQSKQ